MPYSPMKWLHKLFARWAWEYASHHQKPKIMMVCKSERTTDESPHLQEERQEQLQAVTELAAVISGFEMIAFLQFLFDTTEIPRVLQLAYVATSGLTVSPITVER